MLFFSLYLFCLHPPAPPAPSLSLTTASLISSLAAHPPPLLLPPAAFFFRTWDANVNLSLLKIRLRCYVPTWCFLARLIHTSSRLRVINLFAPAAAAAAVRKAFLLLLATFLLQSSHCFLLLFDLLCFSSSPVRPHHPQPFPATTPPSRFPLF